MPDAPWNIQTGNGAVVAAAIHDGHAVRDELVSLFALHEDQRLQEEDPCTGSWTSVADTRIVGPRSRFEVDLNRPREKAVYLLPEDAWGLNVWREPPAAAVIARSLAEYDAFYEEVERVLGDLQRICRHFVVFDLHTYNHRRDGADGPAAPEAGNPEVNVGTGTMDRQRWDPLVTRFLADLRGVDFLGRHLDVRENIKFKGGHFGRWIHERFPESACCLAIEFKKFFMDEWTGTVDPQQVQAIEQALRATVPGVTQELSRL